MTPVERIIMQSYAENTFMFDHEDEKHYLPKEKDAVLLKIKDRIEKEQAVEMTVDQIKAKYRYLRDIFVKTDNLVETKQKVTFLQKCIYQRMFYLKPFILKDKKNVQRTVGKDEKKKVQRSAGKDAKKNVQRTAGKDAKKNVQRTAGKDAKKNVQRTAGRYEVESSIKTGDTPSRAITDEMHKYLEYTKKNIPNDLVNILHERIMSYEDTRTQRLVYLTILKGIRNFTCQYKK